MKRLFITFIVVIFSLVGCGTSIGEGGDSNKNGASNEGETLMEQTTQVDDFLIGIHVDQNPDLEVYATITYTGQESEIDIYHGGSIFFFNIYQQDGDYEYLGAMDEPLLTTTLTKDQPHRVDFKYVSELGLSKGIFEFEALASFFLDQNDWANTNYQIPVSVVVPID